MTSKSVDCEKVFESYCDNENDVSQKVGRGQKKSPWSIKNVVLLGLVISLLLLGRIFDNSLTRLWHRSGSYDKEPPSDEALESLHQSISAPHSLEDTSIAVSGAAEPLWQAGIEGSPILLSVDPDASLADVTPGVSLAAAIDPAGNRQIYDLTSTGNVRLYYLDASNRVVELACNSCGPTTPCIWHRQTYFTATSSGGLSVVYMGSYDGIRVFTTSSNGQVIILQWFQNSWRYYYTGLTVASNSPITAYGVSNSSGVTDAIYALAVDTSGSLQELVWNRYRDYQKFFFGRIVDAGFNTTQANANIGSAYGMPDTYMRVYYLASGVMERYATIDSTAWDQSWVFMRGSEQPDAPGGAVTSISWGNTDVRVYYMAGGSIHEIMLTANIGWRSGKHIQ